MAHHAALLAIAAAMLVSAAAAPATPLRNSINMTMVPISTGSFLLG
jgi:hypothetical protein